MTLVVARTHAGRVAIVADTLLLSHDMPLGIRDWCLKSFFLPGPICVSFSGSPELAANSFREFWERYPAGIRYRAVVEFFEVESRNSNNEFIISFLDGALVTIKNGRRERRLSNTHWIGDSAAWRRFREYEHNRKSPPESGRAMNGVLFADEMTGSPASDLYSTMRNLLMDRDVPAVGGAVTVCSNRDVGFRFSAYSDVLFDWPASLPMTERLKYTDRFDLVSSHENDGFSISQVSPGYYNLNAVGMYLLKGRLLIVMETLRDFNTRCHILRNVEPADIASSIDKLLGFSFGALCIVMSSRGSLPVVADCQSPSDGVRIGLFCEANTFPPTVST
jgi:hypothetical protein